MGNNSISRTLNRRRFIQHSAALAGASNLPSLTVLDDTARSQTGDDPTPWYQRPLRILQTVLRESDARNYDAASVVRYMREAECNLLVVNAGGIVDFFQNPLPAANINPFMGERDILKEITTACKAAGIRVIGRVDFRGVEERVYREHRDWFSVDAAGSPVQLDYTRPRLYASCYTGYHRNEHAEAFVRYLLSNYQLDGIWHNAIAVSGICYCPRCQAAYRQAAAKDLPQPEKATQAELDRYMEWKSQAADRHMERMKKTVKSFGADKVYTAEVFSMFEAPAGMHSGIDLYNARDHFDFLVAVAFLTENRELIHYEDLTYANTVVRFLKSMAPEKEAIILYGGNGTSHRYVMDPPQDLKIWLWEALSAGGRFWNCSFTGMHPNATHDRRNAFNNVDAYRFVKEHEKVLSQQAPVATVGVYYSRPTRLFYRQKPEEGDRFDASIKGVENVLTENHIPFGFVADDQVDAKRLQKYRLLILPNVRCLSSREVALIKDYVRAGGNLLATYATSLHDANGKELTDFSLAEVFGCNYSGKKVNTRQDSYQYILQPGHPLVQADSTDTELLINAAYTLLCKPREGAEVICTYVPRVHNQPPEKAWVQEWSREFPTLIQNSYGNGTVLYFANQPDQISYELGHPDLRQLLLRAVRLLAGSSIPVESTAPESVHIGLTRSARRRGDYVLSLVNATSGPGRPVRRLVPVSDIKVKLRLEERALEDYQVLRAQGSCVLQQKDGELELRISRLEDFCALHIRMK
ncbi:MAG: hypothetical protein EHM61_23325 [Acidobacteria bacterium]|nr:MAG: hypothetical protein EHM61_23325 [Acidobacteriota bacterium]